MSADIAAGLVVVVCYCACAGNTRQKRAMAGLRSGKIRNERRPDWLFQKQVTNEANMEQRELQHISKSCPRCGAPVVRIRRRLIDRLQSIFLPVHRYCCSGAGCGWEGNVRLKELENCDPRT